MLVLALGCSPDASPGGGPPSDTPVTTPPTDDTGASVPSGDTGPAPPASVLQFTGAPPTNLLIVSLDTTRRDYLGWFTGNGNTPNLDAVLAEGVVLERHRSCSSWTVPSMTCVTTGLSPFDLGWWPWTTDFAVPGSDPDLPTLAAQLAYTRGFATTLVTANDLFDSMFHFDNGFATVIRPSWLPAENVTNAALEQALALVGGRDPFYLHVHYIDPHGNYCPPDLYVDASDYAPIGGYDLCYDMYPLAFYEWPDQDPAWQAIFERDLQELYDAEIEYWDAEFGRLWAELDAMGALDDTLVVFVTDHGEQLLERGSLGHGYTLGAEENRSTAAFWAKGIVPRVWTANTVHEDLAATLQDHFDVVPPTPSTGTVVGLAPDDRMLRALLYWSTGAARLSVVQHDTQLLYDWWGEKHFYDHAVDDAGLTDQYDPADPRVLDLWVEMQAFVDDVVLTWPSAGAPYAPGP